MTNRATGTTTRATTGSGGGTAVTRRGSQGTSGIARTGSGDIYAGRDGNVYRRQDAAWQKYDNGSWGAANRPATRDTTRTSSGTDTVRQLDLDRAARGEGAARTRDFGAARGSGDRGSGSYRPSGGARAGGGRRR